MSDYNVVQLARLDPPYLQRLGLRSPPFPPTHEDRFLYLDNERLQLLNMLQHLIEYSNLLLMVVGERGVGKTSLMQRFIAQARPGWQLCPVKAHTVMDADQLLYAIAQGLGLPAPPHDPGSLQDALFQQLVKLREQDRIPILLIDDAHELPLDALQAVFHLADAEAGDGSLLRTILFCEPQIETMLEDPAIQALRERVTHSLELPPLDAEHTVEYLRHRLVVAGHSGALPFSDRQLQQIYKTSGGVPEKINEATHQMLSGTAIEDAGDATGSSRLNPRHLALGLLLAVVVGVVWLLQDEINRLFETPSATTGPPTRTAPDAGSPEAPPTGPILEFPVPQPAPASPPVPAVPDLSPHPPSPGSAAPARPAPAQPVSPPATPAPEVAAETPAPPAPETATAPTLHAIEPAQIPAGEQPVILTLQGDGFTPQVTVVLKGPRGETRLGDGQREVIDATRLRLSLVPGRQTGPREVWVETPDGVRSPALTLTITKPPAAPAGPAPATTPPAARTGVKPPAKPAATAAAPADLWDHGWIERQPADYFTLQILASHSKRNIEAFARQHGLLGMAVAFTSRRNGRPFYALIIGSYPDRRQAQQAISRLPPGLQQLKPALKPWIRRFASIQSALAAPTSAVVAAAGSAPVPPPANTHLTDHVAWLWSQDPSRYTLQLLGGHDRAGVLRFMQQHQLLGKAAYFRTRRDGRDWYVVVYGSYPDRAAARAARDLLPAGIRKTRPFVRQFSEIHARLPHPGPAR